MELLQDFPLYTQSGWTAPPLPVLPIVAGIMTVIFLFNLYVDLRQHSKYHEKEFPPLLASLLKKLEASRKANAAKTGNDGSQEGAEGETDGGNEDTTADASADGKQDADDGKSLYERASEAFHKSQVYGLDKSKFSLFSGTIDQLLTLAFYFGGAYPLLWDAAESLTLKFGFDTTNEIAQSCFFISLYYVVTTTLSMPFALYRTFVLEEKHGFNKQTMGTFVGDLIKKSLLSAVIGLPIVSLLITIIRSTGEHFWLYCWLFTLGTVLFFMTIYPNFIAPLFNKFSPLEAGPLRERIEALAKKLHFPLRKLFVVDGSKRSAHSNAYMYGFCNNKRIVLFDTLVEQATPAEIEAVMGHEFGHWKKGHTLLMMALTQLTLLLQFYIFGQFFHRTELLAGFGFNVAQRPTLITLLLFFEVAFSPVGPLLNFATNAITRTFEFQADRFAADLGYAAELQTGLVKLSVENLGALCVDPVYSAYHYSHPPLVERLNALVPFTAPSKQGGATRGHQSTSNRGAPSGLRNRKPRQA